jgi:hypothetical protein
MLVQLRQIYRTTKENAFMRLLLLTLALLFELQSQSAWAAPPLTGVARTAPVPVAPLSIEQQVAVLQQQVQALQAQLAALQAVVRVTPSGIANQWPTVTIEAGELDVRAANTMTLMAGSSVSVRASGNLALSSSGTAVLQAGATLDLQGSLIRLNGGGKPLATVGSLVQPLPGSPTGSGGAVSANAQVVTGSPTILGN